jgi:hypothetical protein
MPTWEYRVIRLRGPGEEEELNALGQDRWELVSVATEVDEPKAYLKRESIHPASTSERVAELPSALPQAVPSTIGAHATLRVSASDDPGVVGWVDTGLDLGEDCAGISISVDGEVQESSGEIVGPDGSSQHMALNPAIGEELPAGCLVARVGEEGTIETVYFSGFLATDDKGRIYLAVNDESYQNNEGEFTVGLTVL